MERDGENQATAEIIAAAADGPASPNGFGAMVDDAPGLTSNPAVLVAAALLGGFLIARLVRRRGD